MVCFSFFTSGTLIRFPWKSSNSKKIKKKFHAESKFSFLGLFFQWFFPVLRIQIRIRWIRKILASLIWIQICKNMRIHGSGSKGKNINQKLRKKKNFWTIERRDFKNFLISEWFFKFQHKNKPKNKTNNLKILLC